MTVVILGEITAAMLEILERILNSMPVIQTNLAITPLLINDVM